MQDQGHCAGPRYLTSFGRRSFIQVGLLGGFGLTLADLLRAGEVRTPNGPPKKIDGPAKSVIQIILPGGLAHQESWDPKPEAPSNIRGEFKTIRSKVPGIYLSEVMPKLAHQCRFVK